MTPIDLLRKDVRPLYSVPIVLDRATVRIDRTSQFRASNDGPEKDLVAEFVGKLPFRMRPGRRHAIFVEPWLESGAPDLVYVEWKPAVVTRWRSVRASLGLQDIKLLQLLYSRRWQLRDIEDLLGPALLPAIEKLSRAGLLLLKGRYLQPTTLARAFAATRIVAIEAKVSQWSRAIEQAHLNTWFASESYILMPRKPRSSRILERAKAAGIGVWVMNAVPTRVLSPRRHRLPASYASWQFNEWLLELNEATRS
jgi:hypothetical protein